MKIKKGLPNRFWLLTMMDLMLLMLTFFIMLYSMSTPKQIGNALQVQIASSPVATLKRGVHLNYLEQILTQQSSLLTNFEITKEKNSLLIQIPRKIFDTKRNKLLLPEEEIKLKLLGEILSNISNEMLLRAGSDISDIQNALSQAAVIANKIKEGGYTKNLRIIFQQNTTNDFIQIIIFEQIGDE